MRTYHCRKDFCACKSSGIYTVGYFGDNLYALSVLCMGFPCGNDITGFYKISKQDF